MSELPVHDTLDAERAVLGGILRGGKVRHCGELESGDFSNRQYGLLFGVCAALEEDGTLIDPVTVTDKLIELGQFDLLKDPIDLTVGGLVECQPRPEGVPFYAGVVRKGAARRARLRVAYSLLEHAKEGNVDPEEWDSFTTTRVQMLSESRPARCHRYRSVGEIPGVEGIPNEPVRWLVEGFIPRGAFVGLSGEPSCGKTWLGIAVGAAIAQQPLFCGRRISNAPALYVDRENPPAVARTRARLLGIDAGSNGDFKYWGLWLPEQPPMPTDARLLEFAARGGLLIFDSMIRFHSSNENSNDEMGLVNSWFRALVAAGGTVLLLHHKSDKGEKAYRGASEILAGCDCLYSLVKREDNRTLEVHGIKNRFIEEPHFAIERLPQGGFVAADTARDLAAQSLEETIGEVIAGQPGISKSTLETVAVQRAKAKGRSFTRAEIRVAIDSGRAPWKAVHEGANAVRYYPVEGGGKAHVQ